MPVYLDRQKLDDLLAANRLDVSGLARRSGLSRQGVYRMLREDYRPLGRGLEAIAAALDVSALQLLGATEAGDSLFLDFIEQMSQAENGSARAFELMPAQLARLEDPSAVLDLELSPRQTQLLAAAADLAASITNSTRLTETCVSCEKRCTGGNALFFGISLMSPERIVATTPESMKRHLVFGSFSIEDFKRHFA